MGQMDSNTVKKAALNKNRRDRKPVKIGRVVDGEIVLNGKPRGRKNQEYSESTKTLAKTLYAEGYSFRQIAAEINVSKSAVSRWVMEIPKDEQALLRDADLSGQIKKSMSARMILVASHLVASINEKKIKAAGLMPTALASKILFDAALNLIGEPTQTIKVISQAVTTRDMAMEQMDAERDLLKRQLSSSQIIDVEIK